MGRKAIVIGLASLLVGWLLLDAMGVFDETEYTAIPHGSHDHYVPNELDEGVGADNCPTRAPEVDEFISLQCQMIKVVENQGQTYYMPDTIQSGIPYSQLPRRAPASGEIINPVGQLIKAETQ